MPPARATSENKNSSLYVMVLFIVLFLAAAIFAIVQYMNNEDLVNNAQDAEDRLALLATNSEYNSVKDLAISSGSRRTTALSRIARQFDDINEAVGGTDAESVPLTGAATAIIDRAEITWNSAQNNVLGADMLDESIGLAGLAEWLIEQTAAWQARCLTAETTMVEQSDRYQRQADDMEAEMEQIRTQLQLASRAGQDQAKAYEELHADETARYEEIITGLNNQLDQAQEQEELARDQMQEMEQALAAFEAEVRRLNERLQMFQPDPETEAAALEPDGHIVSVVLRDGFAYINLGQNDHIYRGLTFTVYDSYQPIPRSGQGKGTIEVIEIMGRISKCRIVDYDRTNPILDGDTIANLIWSIDKEFLFCVVGDFDFDGDGEIDHDGREQIVERIEEWGGKATDSLAVDTDFLVVGHPPIVSELPANQFIDSDTPAAREYRLSAERAESYESVLQRGSMLGVPTFNQSRFFNFIGYHHQPLLAR